LVYKGKVDGVLKMRRNEMAKVSIQLFNKLDRAWLLIKDQNTSIPSDYFEPNNLNKMGFFIVRADTVETDPEQYNLMVPVYYFIDGKIDGLDNVKQVFEGLDFITAKVTAFNPGKPHHAKGYIPYFERNPNRPGPRDWNTWG
jgi:hypothetical protein